MFAIILILCACKSNKTGGDALVEQDSISTELNDDKISALTNRNIDDVEITGEVLHTRMTYFNFDSVKNLVSFFEEIELKHEKIVFCEEDKSTVDRCILPAIDPVCVRENHAADPAFFLHFQQGDGQFCRSA